MRHKSPVTLRSLVLALIALAVTAPAGLAESISGTLKVPPGIDPSGICVTAVFRTGVPTTVFSGAGGVYSIPVTAGQYMVTANSDVNATAYPESACLTVRSDVAQAVPPGGKAEMFVTVAAGQDVTGINRTLVRTGSVTGKVLVPTGGRMEGICINVFDVSGAMPDGPPIAVTDAAGAFSIKGLLPGQYLLKAGGIHRDCPGQEDLGSQTAVVDVVGGKTTSGVHFALGTRADNGAGGGAAKPLAVAPATVSATSIAQAVTAPGAGLVTQTGTLLRGGRAGKAVSACSGWANVAKAGKVVVACRLTYKAYANRRSGAIRIRLTTTFRGKAGVYRDVRVVTLPKSTALSGRGFAFAQGR